MTSLPTPTLSDRVAEEIRAWMGRRRVTGATIAKELGVSAAWISYRLSGRQPIDLNDLAAIARVLDVPVADLLPADIRAAGAAASINRTSTRPRDNRPATRRERRVTDPAPPVPPSAVRRPQRISGLSEGASLHVAA
jgi:transcriptional regulator with XRE-family HTH domain